MRGANFVGLYNPLANRGEIQDDQACIAMHAADKGYQTRHAFSFMLPKWLAQNN